MSYDSLTKSSRIYTLRERVSDALSRSRKVSPGITKSLLFSLTDYVILGQVPNKNNILNYMP